MNNTQDITKIDNFFDKENATRFYKKLFTEISWLNCEWTSESCSSSYIYGKREKEITPKKSIDDIINIVEERLETKVVKVWLWLYKHGEEHMCYRSLSSNSNLLHIFLGTTRKICMKTGDQEDAQVYKMKHGDSIFISEETNTNQFHYSVPSNGKIKSSTIHICISLENPRSYRFRKVGKLHLLGRGIVDVTYDTRVYPNGLPENMVAADMPIDCIPPGENEGSIRLLENYPSSNILQGMLFAISAQIFDLS